MNERPDLSGAMGLVTGASRRLGRHLALELAAAGADVCVHYSRDAEGARETVAAIEALGRRAFLVAADFTDPAGIAALIEGYRAQASRLDVLVNNVGNYIVKPVEETSVDEWRSLLDANLVAPAGLINGLLDLFPEGAGSIVNLGYAGVDLLASNPEATAYQASKAGLLILTKSLATRLAPRGLRVNMISPGQLENSVDLPEDIPAAIPLARAGTLDDIAHAMHYLVRPGSYVTGVNLDVAGGYRLQVR